MHLSSSLEPNGPKFSGHYLVLRHESRRNLIELPKTYQDLQKQVETLYHLKPDEFYVESKELNMCAGDSIQIPGELWADIAELLGNVYVVLRPVDAHPGSGEPPSSAFQPKVQKIQGTVTLGEPLVQDQIVVINLSDMDEAGPSSKIKLDICIVEEEQDYALKIDIAPKSGPTFPRTTNNPGLAVTPPGRPIREVFPLTADHIIIIRKLESTFLVLFDYLLAGEIKPPTNRSLIAVKYDFGTDSPFKGNISANVYSGLRHFKEHPRLRYFILDKDALYRRIINRDPSEASHILGELSAVRVEVASFKVSTSGIKWRVQRLPHIKWASLDWEIQPHSLYVLRFKLQNTTSMFYIRFGGTRVFYNYTLHLKISPDNKVVFSEGNGTDGHHKIKLAKPIHTTGEHTIAFINHGGKMYVIFDFKQATVLPRTTMVTQKTTEVHLEICNGVEADVYDF